MPGEEAELESMTIAQLREKLLSLGQSYIRTPVGVYTMRMCGSVQWTMRMCGVYTMFREWCAVGTHIPLVVRSLS
jgi:hypothetical protein